MGNTKNDSKKGRFRASGQKGRARGARSSIAGILMEKEEDNCPSAKDRLGDFLAQTKFPGSFVPGEVNLDVG